MAFQNRRFGCVQLCSQFLRVPRLTPSFAANVIVEKPDSSLYFISDFPKDCVLFWQGGESTLTALITRWQKGCRNHPFRQFFHGISPVLTAKMRNCDRGSCCGGYPTKFKFNDLH